jgi:Phosphotransferase enzyme family
MPAGGHAAIPATFGDVTVEWCRARIQDRFDDLLVEVGATGVQDGRFGTTARLSLTWAHGQGPPTMIVKLASASPRTRQAGRLHRTYEVETGFYQDMARHVGAHVAHCYFAAYDQDTGGYCLLLEDITGAVQGDQVAGSPPGHVLTALTELARLHASTFGDERLRVLPWLRGRSPVITSHAAAAMALRWSRRFTTRLADSLHRDIPQALDLLSASAPAYGGSPSPSPSPSPEVGVALVHGDFRSENLLFRAGHAVVLDWQTAGQGAAMADVSYFIGTSAADAGEPARHARYLDHYLAQLRAEGAVPDQDQCWRDYRAYAFGGLIMAIVGWVLVDRTPRGDDVFAAMANRAASHAIQVIRA